MFIREENTVLRTLFDHETSGKNQGFVLFWGMYYSAGMRYRGASPGGKNPLVVKPDQTV